VMLERITRRRRVSRVELQRLGAGDQRLTRGGRI
jgi:hypothetical protein